MSRRVKSRSAPRARSMSGAMLRRCSVGARSSKRPGPAGARRSGLGNEGNLISGRSGRPSPADREPEEDQHERDQEEQEEQKPWVQAGGTGDERPDVLQARA